MNQFTEYYNHTRIISIHHYELLAQQQERWLLILCPVTSPVIELRPLSLFLAQTAPRGYDRTMVQIA